MFDQLDPLLLRVQQEDGFFGILLNFDVVNQVGVFANFEAVKNLLFFSLQVPYYFFLSILDLLLLAQFLHIPLDSAPDLMHVGRAIHDFGRHDHRIPKIILNCLLYVHDVAFPLIRLALYFSK